VGLLTATVSVTLNSYLYVHAMYTGGYPFYHPVELMCIRWGTLTALLGIVAAAMGTGKGRNPLASISVLNLVLWFAAGMAPLTWALEVGDVQRFSSIKKAISYCGLCGAEKSSGSTVQRTPLSKQRNKHLQTTLIEAAKMAPRNSPELGMLHDKEKQKGNANRATLAVARKLVAYLVAVDRRQKEFLTVERENRTAA
jgi:hypothetical protein